MRGVNFLPPAAFHGIEETLDVIRHIHFEMFGQLSSQFTPAVSKLTDFPGDDFVRCGRTLTAAAARLSASRQAAPGGIRGSGRRQVGGTRAVGREAAPRRAEQDGDCQDQGSSNDEPRRTGMMAGCFARGFVTERGWFHDSQMLSSNRHRAGAICVRFRQAMLVSAEKAIHSIDFVAP